MMVLDRAHAPMRVFSTLSTVHSRMARTVFPLLMLNEEYPYYSNVPALERATVV